MVERKRKKKNKLRGKRTHGKGDTKNKRGAGCRGGRGRAGSRKHKYVKYLLEGSLKKKKRLNPKKKLKTINLGLIEEKMNYFLEKKFVEKKGEEFLIDGKQFPFEKILGAGELKKKLVLKNIKVSKNAEEKIVNAGGSVERIEEEKAGKEKEETEKEIEGKAGIEGAEGEKGTREEEKKTEEFGKGEEGTKEWEEGEEGVTEEGIKFK